MNSMSDQQDSAVTVNQQLGVATAVSSHWRDPYVESPPRGAVLLLLTWDNRQLEGTWGKDAHLSYAAWAPKPSRPDWLKERMWQKYIGLHKPVPVEPA